MAYIPPHKRHSSSSGSTRPTPEFLVPRFKRNVNLRPSKSNGDRSGKIVYADNAISRWFAVGLDDDSQVPSSVHFDPVSMEYLESKTGEKPLMLVNSHLDKENNEVRGNPMVSIAENVLQDILSSFEVLKAEMECQGLEEMKPTLVARFGKILFFRSTSGSLESVRKSQVTEATLRQLHKMFYTNLPASYLENILDEVVSKIGLDFEEEKDIYHVKLSDSRHPKATLSCKCSLKEDNKLQLYKVELNQMRNLVADISCLDRDLDLRLMLSTKRILSSLTDDEINSIRNLIESAVPDPDVKGGLRWPVGKMSYGDRYSVIGVWHTVAVTYKSSSLRLKIRSADRFDFRTATGETSKEVFLKLKGIVSELLGQEFERNLISDMLKEALGLICEYFLGCERFLT